jgi:hypothetical protein
VKILFPAFIVAGMRCMHEAIKMGITLPPMSAQNGWTSWDGVWQQSIWMVYLTAKKLPSQHLWFLKLLNVDHVHDRTDIAKPMCELTSEHFVIMIEPSLSDPSRLIPPIIIILHSVTEFLFSLYCIFCLRLCCQISLY